jgi:hypothetical protein
MGAGMIRGSVTPNTFASFSAGKSGVEGHFRLYKNRCGRLLRELSHVDLLIMRRVVEPVVH